MKCSLIKELLYDFLTKKLDKHTSDELKEHLETCIKCRSVQEDISKTILFLDQWEVPEVSSDFENRVMEKIEEKQPISFFLLKDIIRYPAWTFAMAAVLLIALISVYVVFPRSKNLLPKNVQIDLEKKGVKHPIILKTENNELALKEFKKILKNHNGNILFPVFLDKGIIVTFKVEKPREKEFFSDLSRLGDLQITKEGYRDKKGNPVIILQEKT